MAFALARVASSCSAQPFGCEVRDLKRVSMIFDGVVIGGGLFMGFASFAGVGAFTNPLVLGLVWGSVGLIALDFGAVVALEPKKTPRFSEEIIRGIWLGGKAQFDDPAPFDIIITVCPLSDLDSSGMRHPGVTWHYLGDGVTDTSWDQLVANCSDREEAPFERLFRILDGARGKRVLVHCLAGVNRSATVLAAYLVSRHGHTVDSALAYIKRRRPCVDPMLTPQLQRSEAVLSQRLIQHNCHRIR